VPHDPTSTSLHCAACFLFAAPSAFLAFRFFYGVSTFTPYRRQSCMTAADIFRAEALSVFFP